MFWLVITKASKATNYTIQSIEILLLIDILVLMKKKNEIEVPKKGNYDIPYPCFIYT